MTPNDFVSLVGRLSYKPAVTLEAQAYSWGVQFNICLSLTDANDPASKNNPLKFGSALPAEILGYFNESRTLNWLRERFHEWERHEADEWLRIDGAKVFNPHGADAALLAEQTP